MTSAAHWFFAYTDGSASAVEAMGFPRTASRSFETPSMSSGSRVFEMRCPPTSKHPSAVSWISRSRTCACSWANSTPRSGWDFSSTRARSWRVDYRSSRSSSLATGLSVGWSSVRCRLSLAPLCRLGGRHTESASRSGVRRSSHAWKSRSRRRRLVCLANADRNDRLAAPRSGDRVSRRRCQCTHLRQRRDVVRASSRAAALVARRARRSHGRVCSLGTALFHGLHGDELR